MNPLRQTCYSVGRFIGDRFELAIHRLISSRFPGSMFRRIFGSAATLGVRGERAAARFLNAKGLFVVERNCRNRLGEIDLICVHQKTLVFVEVKTRRTEDKGSPLDAVDQFKQNQITRVAIDWLKRHDLLEHAYRFDVIAVVWNDEFKLPEITHVESAFAPIAKYQMHV